VKIIAGTGFGHDEVQLAGEIDLSSFDRDDIHIVWDAHVVSTSGGTTTLQGDLAIVVDATGDSILLRDVVGYRQNVTGDPETAPVRENHVSNGSINMPDMPFFDLGDYDGYMFVDGISNVDFVMGDTSQYAIA